MDTYSLCCWSIIVGRAVSSLRHTNLDSHSTRSICKMRFTNFAADWCHGRSWDYRTSIFTMFFFGGRNGILAIYFIEVWVPQVRLRPPNAGLHTCQFCNKHLTAQEIWQNKVSVMPANRPLIYGRKQKFKARCLNVPQRFQFSFKDFYRRETERRKHTMQASFAVLWSKFILPGNKILYFAEFSGEFSLTRQKQGIWS